MNSMAVMTPLLDTYELLLCTITLLALTDDSHQLGNVTVPVVSANIATNNTLLASRIKPYHIFPEHSLAVIGLTTIHTKTTSSPGSGTEFLDPVQILQQTVDVIEANENVTRIIAMTHIGSVS